MSSIVRPARARPTSRGADIPPPARARAERPLADQKITEIFPMEKRVAETSAQSSRKQARPAEGSDDSAVPEAVPGAEPQHQQMHELRQFDGPLEWLGQIQHQLSPSAMADFQVIQTRVQGLRSKAEAGTMLLAAETPSRGMRTPTQAEAAKMLDGLQGDWTPSQLFVRDSPSSQQNRPRPGTRSSGMQTPFLEGRV